MFVYVISVGEIEKFAVRGHRWRVTRQLSVYYLHCIYKTILKSIWTYGIPLWDTASNSNIEILQKYQNKVFRAIVNAPWFISDKVLHTHLEVPTIREKL